MLNRLSIEDGTLHFADRSLPNPFEVTLRTADPASANARRFGTITLRTSLRARSADLGQYPCTSCHLGRAVTMAEQRQQPFHLARALIQHARWYEAQGRSSDAMAWLNRAYTIAQQQGDRYAMSRALNPLCRTSAFAAASA